MNDWYAKMVRRQADEEAYYALARAVGVSREVAAYMLREVAEEAASCHAYVDVIGVARRRLTEGGPAYRPATAARDQVRRACQQAGWNDHPEHVDYLVRGLGLEAGATLADEMRATRFDP